MAPQRREVSCVQPLGVERGRPVPLPTGTVTFLFTDIEGSTRRWDADRIAMTEAVHRHDAVGKAAINAHRGYIFKTLGDAFCCAFASPEDAVAAALGFQRALAAEDFSAVGGLRIRAALHTGTADERAGDYFGPTVNRVARLLAIGHGEQIIASGVTQDLALGALPSQAAFKDLGAHRLKDLSRPEQVYQLVAPGLRAEFPALRSLSALPNNLPTELTSFVGRDHDVATITTLLEHNRLVTLAGSGGVGKTRTSLQVAANLLDGSGDGVWFIELAPLPDGALIASAVANTLGITLPMELDSTTALVAALKSKTMLLVFDNCEHVVEAAAGVISAILRGAPNVTILASSRQGLGVLGEETYRMPSLGVPSEAESASLDASNALRFGAIALFVDRAISADKRFALTAENAPIVADIVRRLDGIALAIELAASRVKMLDVRQLDKRLDERFRILTGGGRDALPRQQTLRALIDWSYDLLDSREKLLFQRVGIFVDGFTMEAAVAVCCDETLDEFDLFDVLASLVDKSLVVAEFSLESTRYRLLESTRAYALEKLSTAFDRPRMSQRHLDWMRTIVVAAEELFETQLRDDAFQALRDDVGNLRAAVSWARESGDPDVGAAIIGSFVEGAVRRFASEIEWLAQSQYFLDALPDDRSSSLAKLHTSRSGIEGGLGRTNEALSSAERAVNYARASGDTFLLARARTQLAVALSRARRFDETEAIVAELEAAGVADLSPRMFVRYHTALALRSTYRGDADDAKRAYELIFAKYRALGVPMTNDVFVINFAEMEHLRGNTARAVAFVRERLPSITSRRSRADILMNLAGYLVAVDDVPAARRAAEDSRDLRNETDTVLRAVATEHLALVIALEGDLRRAARVLGYTSYCLARAGFERENTERTTYDRLRALLADELDSDEIARCEAQGRDYTPRQALDEASARVGDPAPLP